MKKLIPVLLGLSLLGTTIVSTFAQETKKAPAAPKKNQKKGSKKKQEETKK